MFCDLCFDVSCSFLVVLLLPMFGMSRTCAVQLLLQCPHSVGDFVFVLSRPTLPIGGGGSAWCQAKCCVCAVAQYGGAMAQ